MSQQEKFDYVLDHGRWCLSKAAYPENQKRIQQIMDDWEAKKKLPFLQS